MYSNLKIYRRSPGLNLRLFERRTGSSIDDKCDLIHRSALILRLQSAFLPYRMPSKELIRWCSLSSSATTRKPMSMPLQGRRAARAGANSVRQRTWRHCSSAFFEHCLHSGECHERGIYL